MTDRLDHALHELPQVSPPPLLTLLGRPRRRRSATVAALPFVVAGLFLVLLGGVLFRQQTEAPLGAPSLLLAPGQSVEFTEPPYDGLLQTPAGVVVLLAAQFTATQVARQELHLTLGAGAAILPDGDTLPCQITLVLTPSGWRPLADQPATASQPVVAEPAAPSVSRVPVPLDADPVQRVPFHVWAVETTPRFASAAGARVRVHWESDGRADDAWIATDAEGRGVALVPGDATALRVMATAVPGGLWTDGPWQVVPESTGFLADRPVRTLTARPRTVRGRVVDTANRPVARARLRVWSGTLDRDTHLELGVGATPASEVREFASDAEGRFVLHDLGGSLALRAFTESATSMVTLQAAGATGDRELTLRLWPAVTLRGQVTRPDGSTPGVGQVRLALPLEVPLPSVSVSRAQDQPTQPTHEWWQARIEGDGSFVVQGVPRLPEALILSTSVPSCAPSRAVVQLHQTGSEPVVRITLQAAAQLHGVVRQAAGEPVADAQVAAYLRGDRTRLAEAVTGPTGSFVLTDLPPGRVRIQVRPRSGQASQDFWVVTQGGPDEPLAISLEPAWPLRGALVDAAGQPLVGVRVALEPQVLDDPRATATVRAAVTGAGGQFLFQDLPAGRYALRAAGGREAVPVRPGGEFLRIQRP